MGRGSREKGREGGGLLRRVLIYSRDGLDGAAKSFLRFYHPQTRVWPAFFWCLNPVARCFRALGVSTQPFFLGEMIDEVLMILIPHIPSCTV